MTCPVNKKGSTNVLEILGEIIDILSRINQGGYWGDIEQRIEEVRNDLSKMQETN